MLTKYQIEDMRDTHLVGPEEEYNEAERDIATLLHEVSLMEAQALVHQEEKETLIAEVNSARKVYKRLITSVLKEFKAVDFQQVHDRIATLERVARAALALDTGKDDLFITANSERGLNTIDEFYDALDLLQELDTAALDV